jgi:hypothetical protein
LSYGYGCIKLELDRRNSQLIEDRLQPHNVHRLRATKSLVEEYYSIRFEVLDELLNEPEPFFLPSTRNIVFCMTRNSPEVSLNERLKLIRSFLRHLKPEVPGCCA